MIRGTVITLGDKRYVMPPMNVATMELHKEFFKGVASGTVPIEDMMDKLGIIADIVHRCLCRNYPDLKLELVQEHVDMGNMEELMGAVAKTSGLVLTTGE